MEQGVGLCGLVFKVCGSGMGVGVVSAVSAWGQGG